MTDVFVTVGMSRWPFDRLIEAAGALARDYRVFGQIGHASTRPPFPHSRFLPFDELRARIASADVVVTHAGNTVRLAQRNGKVPVAVARRASLGEMGNDHQVEYLHQEAHQGRVIPLWDHTALAAVVRRHAELQAGLLASRPAPPTVDLAGSAELINSLLFAPPRSPFARHPLRRYHYAWSWLARRSGRHLDVGCGTGEFLQTLAATTDLHCFGIDAHRGYLAELARRAPLLDTRLVPTNGSIPFAAGQFDSISALDVLEHVGDENLLLSEIHRVLAPRGMLILTVPARHVFSFLDPDNAKFRFPRIHKFVYTRKFGPEVYHERFVDRTNGMRGDIAVERDEHRNYVRRLLEQRLNAHGLRAVHADGANLFWRLLQTPALLTGGRTRRSLERLIELDGRMFSAANLFITAIREPI